MEIKTALVADNGIPVYRTTETVNSGTLVIYCDGSCGDPRLEHRYMGYSTREAVALYNEEHEGDPMD